MITAAEMTSFPKIPKKADQKKRLQQFAQLRERVHRDMKAEENARLKENPTPTEQELYMATFTEWLEPQVRDAIREMYRKGYATVSSGFHAEEPDLQLVDGYFSVHEETKAALKTMGVEVLRGVDIGLPKNKFITVIRFRADTPSLDEMKAKWDGVAAALPSKTLPASIRAICERAEEFREGHAPQDPSLERDRTAYIDYLKSNVQ